MSRNPLNLLLAPSSVAVVGASDRENSVGGIVFRNMVEAGFHGKLYPVNSKHPQVGGMRAYPSVADIDAPVDLAVIATPAATVPGILDSCGKRGVTAAIVLSAGFREVGPDGEALERKLLDTARNNGIRILGPNCLGVVRPSLGLNATFSLASAWPGNLALVTQSGALMTAILDWALPNEVGFSSMASLGGAADVDFGEVLDYLVYDRETEAILLYVEGIRDARGFMSALRAAARAKPVIVLKSDRTEAGARAAVSHTAAVIGGDHVFDAALKRAGVVRVNTVVQLFEVAKALATRIRPRGDRLAVVTNAGGPGVMAADRASTLGVVLAELAPATVEALNGALPPAWSHANPVDILGDAGVERYRAAMSACLADPGVDGVLAVLTPQAMTQPTETADAVVEAAAGSDKPVIACWMGETHVKEGRARLAKAHIPVFRTPEPAVEVFAHISTFYANQKLLLEAPPPLALDNAPDVEGARLIIEGALSERRKVLSEMETKALLAAFRIPVARTMVARSPSEALLMAEELGMPVAMKIASPDVIHKRDAGGVRLNVATAQGVRSGYHDIVEAVRRLRPNARVDGVAIEPMAAHDNGREVMVGVATDPVFGPVITFGWGGSMVEVVPGSACALPPLNRYLARRLIDDTWVAKLLGAFRHLPPANVAALESVLLRVSEMVCELPWLKELDINPLIVDDVGAMAVDARAVVDFPPAGRGAYRHMAIHPYPANLVESWQLPDGKDVLIRPIRPEDADMVQAFVRGLSPESRYFRFLSALRELPPGMLARLTQIDYDREMALVAEVREADGRQLIGVTRYVANLDGTTCEFALVVADAWQHRGIGAKLVTSLIDIARSRGLVRMEGDVLASNRRMLTLVASLGFTIESSSADPSLKVVSRRI